jgi:UDP-N-acetylmuramoyl-L-alanyl-D-glutamate--2,6-diaminopimelate ligase
MSKTVALPIHFSVTCHTDNVGPGSTFVVIQGMSLNGAEFIPEAIKRGASCIVLEHNAVLPHETEQLIQNHAIRVERVENTRLALAQMSAHATGYPAKKLRIIGITGTKGKTTTSLLAEHIFRSAGYKTALISTAKNSINGHYLKAPLTTPQPDYLQHFLQCCVDQQIDIVVMEVAAQALSLHRTAGIEFDGALFTNFSLEHLEFYPSMEHYFEAKRALFTQCKPNAPMLINGDDVHGKKLLSTHANAISFGIREQSAIYGFIHATSDDKQGLTMTVIHGAQEITLACPGLFGNFNAYNILAAVSMALCFDIKPDAIANALSTFPGVPGRLEKYNLPNGASCIIDYAHNPSSYEAVLSLLKSKTDNLIVIFGAGGKRDPSKRPIMGAIAAQYADLIILTSDNPRDEDPLRIIEDIATGIPHDQQHKILREVDREKAIQKAYAYSKTKTIIAILGKGTDEYQIIGTRKLPFSEIQIIKSLSGSSTDSL